MKLLVIDGQGGQLGGSIIKAVIERYPEIEIIAVGTNANATACMVKAGAKKAATGENPVLVTASRADVIIGPVGIVIADAMLGEITSKMAEAVGKSEAIRILIPMNKCENLIAGVRVSSVSVLIEDALEKLGEILSKKA